MTTTDTRHAPSRTGAVVVLGSGRLRDAVTRALATHHAGNLPPLTVTASDTWANPPGEVRTGTVWLPVRAELGRVVVGPARFLAQPGCPRCFELRRGRARVDATHHAAVLREHTRELAACPSAWLTTLACDTVAVLVTDELDRIARHRTLRTRNAVLYVDLQDLTVTRHRFLPEPLCPDCGELPDDSPELAEIALCARPKPAPTVHRVRDVITELDDLTATYVGTEAGLVRELRRGLEAGTTIAAAALPLRGDDKVEVASGRTDDYRSSELVALLEALERWGGFQPGGKRTTVLARYDEVADHALDPRTLGTHSPEDYARPGYPFRPFDPTEARHWVWAYSFARREPVLVPATSAYYGKSPGGSPEQRPSAYETSNGCALGSCLEEAILYGLLEIAERDAFLLTWYGRIPAPRIDLRTAGDPAVALQAAVISAETGYELTVYDTTTETGIPTVWAMATTCDNAHSKPKALCAAGAHPDLERAVLGALRELGPILANLITTFPGNADRARDMLADPARVTTMADHSTLYGAHEAFERLGFLTTTPHIRDLAEVTPQFRHDDLRDDLTQALHRYLDRGMDVLVVDQTGPEHRAGGFRCVKVLVPGTAPMTFGHIHRRTEHLPRLRYLPHLLGHRSAPLRPAELNPHPHPFP
jgi:ribosomal protein S12 methylthiotransferase accessory factor